MQRNRNLEEQAKKAKKATVKKKPFVAPGEVLDYCPQWMGANAPRRFNWAEMSHAHWVAAWWSRALSQLASQGHAESESVTFASLLTEFLNTMAWEYDRRVWTSAAEKAARKDPDLDVNKSFAAANQNELLEVKNIFGGKGEGKFGKVGTHGNGGSPALRKIVFPKTGSTTNKQTNKKKGQTVL